MKLFSHTVNGKKLCYMLNQDVDYPMYLVEAWSKQVYYEPGGYSPQGGIWQCWRQCWMYVGPFPQ